MRSVGTASGRFVEGAERSPLRDLASGAGGLIVVAALLGGTLGYVGFAGWEFWRNREMCACASVGLVDDATAGVDRATRAQLQGGATAATLVGTALGAGAGVGAWLVSVRRMRRMLRVLAE